MDKAGEENFVVKILHNEAIRLVGVVSVVIGVMGFLYSIKLDIALIKQNHLTHIESIERELQEQKEDIIELKKEQIGINQRQLLILEKLKQ